MSRPIMGMEVNYYDVEEAPRKGQDFGPGDHEFIKKMILRLPVTQRHIVTKCYNSTYTKELQNLTIPSYQRIGSARYKANTQLMEIVEAFTEQLKPEGTRKLLQKNNSYPYQV